MKKTIICVVITEVYLPNPKADYDEYVNDFKVSVAEFDNIRNMGNEVNL